MCRASLAAAALVLCGAGAALAQPPAPDFQRDIAQIAALERIRLAARVTEADEADEARAGIADQDLPLVLARVTALDAAAGAALADAGTTLPALGAAAASAQARLMADLPHDPAQLAAGIAAALLLPEGGVAERYEEAAGGEAGDYALAHHGLLRVAELIAPLDLDPQARARVTASLDRLMAAIPARQPPYARMLPGGEIEFETQVLASTLLAATGAPAWPGHDLTVAAPLVGALVRQGCDDPDPDLGRESLAIARFYHLDGLSATLSLFAAEAEAQAAGAYRALAAGGPDAAACAALAEALARARPVLGG